MPGRKGSGGWPSRARNLVQQAADLHRGVSLVQGSRELGASLDCQDTLRTAARLVVSHLADACVGYLVEEDQRVHAVVVAAADPTDEAVLEKQLLGQEVDPAAPDGVARALRVGRSEIVAGWPAGRDSAGDADLTAGAGANGHSFLAVPLVARGHPVGALVLAAEAARAHDPETVMLAEDLAGRAGLAIDNARLYRRAEAAIRARDEFLANISHDLKGPLTHIRARSELLRARVAHLETPETGELAEGLAQIHGSTGRMIRMLNELQDLAQLQAGRVLELIRQPTDLVAVARRLVAEYSLLSRRHRLLVEAAESEMVGVWDTFRVERVLSNLLSNAIKFSPAEGEIVVALSREDGPGGEWAVVKVKDHGIGIPAAEIGQVFEPFRRATNTRGRIGGTGLGLSGSRRIIEQHGGTLELTSREGAGTTVTVQLPISVGAEQAIQPRPDPPAGRRCAKPGRR